MSKSLFSWLLFSIICWGFPPPVLAEEKPSNRDFCWLSGYQHTVDGQVMAYHSPFTDTNSALIVRANRTCPSITWETEPVPADAVSKGARFVWPFGIDANIETRSFTLSVNNDPLITFQNPDSPDMWRWSVEGKKGTHLKFRVIMTDQYDDLMGFCVLSVPAELLKGGEPVRLRVDSEDCGSPVWFMTFQRFLAESVEVEQLPALIKKDGRTAQQGFLNIIHLGEPSMIGIESRQQVILEFIGETPMPPIRSSDTLRFHTGLEPGLNRFDLYFWPVDHPTKIDLEITVGGLKITGHKSLGVMSSYLEPEKSTFSFMLEPIRKWTLYLVQHSHTDIGYTRPQTEILPEHLRFIDYALDYCDQTDDYPDDARFRWTCESSWAVREYLRYRPAEQIERLRQRVREGRIEVTGMMFNLSELPDEPSFSAFLNPVGTIKQAGLPVRTAMQNDVNGIAWCLADYFPAMGIRYLVMGQHPHRALTSFKKPTAFWWLSPSGSKVLGFRADHYMTANFWGLNSNEPTRYSNEQTRLESKLFGYLSDLHDKGYPYDRIEVQYSGSLTDNAPPSTTACDVIRKWNESYAWPRLRSATISEFMDYLADEHGDTLPEYRAAWPDWWSDGFGSATRETAAARQTHADLITAQGLLAMAVRQGADLPAGLLDELSSAYDALLFYDEHTFGADESISNPLSENNLIQWGEKSAYVWEAVKRTRLLNEAALGLMQSYLPSSPDAPTVHLMNTLNWNRSGMPIVYIDHQIMGADQPFKIIDPQGNPVAFQHISSRPDGTYWALWVEDLPSMGIETYRIERHDHEPASAKPSDGLALENRFYRIEIDAEKGALRHLVDKELDIDLVDPDAEWGFLSFIHEQLENRHQIEQFKLERFERTPWQSIQIEPGTDGPIWKSVTVSGHSVACLDGSKASCEIRLFKLSKRIEFHFKVHKMECVDPEGIYIAFPFALAGGEIVYEAQGGMVRPGQDQMPGSASDWHTVQNFACIRNDQAQIVLQSNEIHLMQFGGLNLGKFQYQAEVEKSHIYSWVLNNYWTTNFKASQEGELKWHYALTSGRRIENNQVVRFGWGNRVPIAARVLPQGRQRARQVTPLLLDEASPHLLLVAVRPAKEDRSVIMHWREVDGVEARLDPGLFYEPDKTRPLIECNILEEPIRKVNGPLVFKPYEVKFIKVTY